jgi:hypothetical protein
MTIIPNEAYTYMSAIICEFCARQYERYQEDTAYSFDQTEIYYEGETYTLGVSGYVYCNADYSIEIKIDSFTCTDIDGNEIQCNFDKRALR